jgi:hypothetical protein
MTEQIPNRIEAFLDLSRFVYLREAEGALRRGDATAAYYANSAPVVVAEEIDGEDRVVRTWFVMPQPNRDGFGLTAPCPPHRIVSRDVRPGEPTPAYDPNAEARIVQTYGDEELKALRRARDERIADRERHIRHAQTYTDAVNRRNQLQAEVERLNQELVAKGIEYSAELKKRDDENWELKNERTLNRLQIATLQASYSKLWNQKSLTGRVKTWLLSVRKCKSKPAE